MLRIIRFFWIFGRLKSRKRYFRRSSSFTVISASIGKGGVSDSDKIRILSTFTSISPVARFSFTAPLLFSTVPVTAITNSALKEPAFLKPSSPIVSSSKYNWINPLLSRKSTKIRLPRFLLFCTHPIRVTVSPIFSLETSVHLWDLFNPFMDSAILFSS